MYGVCDIAALPMRAEASERAEMVSQLIFGDAYKVIETKDKWLKINTFDCGYEGWIDKKMHNPLHEKDVEDYISAEKYVVTEYMFFIQDFISRISFPVFAGAAFPYPKDGTLILGNSIFSISLLDKEEQPVPPQLTAAQHSLLRFAAMFLNAPYLWGGRTPIGIDCSGLTQLAYKSIGISLPRDASQQAGIGELVDFVDEARAGDLAFFQNSDGDIIHVGIVCDNKKILHASGKVRIDTLDQTGIFNKAAGKYTHILRIIKRILV
ncbi:MAG: C40 family peptidase [Bacteroidales bacterium]|nr:C40 family peptidase [Bacteroidales bacterium]MBQ7489502.1 C40 family peptidase [Bacteroidales bacterium]